VVGFEPGGELLGALAGRLDLGQVQAFRDGKLLRFGGPEQVVSTLLTSILSGKVIQVILFVLLR
jgi:hypothetical protein